MLLSILSAHGSRLGARTQTLYLGPLLRRHRSDKKVVRPLVICGPSGVGKSTLIKRVMFGNEELFGFSVSHTTRRPRPGEKHGVDYHFASEEEMRGAIAKGEFLEYAEVHGNLYGTSVTEVRKVHHSEKICVLDIDVQGVKSFKAHQAAKEFDPVFVFIAPPAVKELASRLTNRGTEEPTSFQRRIDKAPEEIEFGTATGNFDTVIVNDVLERAQEELEQKLREWFPFFVPQKSKDSTQS